jgi:hypothetical protein
MTNKFIGVRKDCRGKRARWMVVIEIEKKRVIHECESELEAAKEYDRYVKKYKLDRKLNFPPPTKYKKCSRCAYVKKKTEFYKKKLGRDGLTAMCKECVKDGARKYDKNNRSKTRERSRRRYSENTEMHLSRTKKYREDRKRRLKTIRRMELFGVPKKEVVKIIEKKKCPRCKVEKSKDNFSKSSFGINSCYCLCDKCLS